VNRLEQEYEKSLQTQRDYIDNITRKKYCINESEKSLDDVIFRIEENIKQHASKNVINRIIEMMKSRRFLAGGSILFGLGNTETKCSISNCYFIPVQEDSIEGIFDAIKHIGRTYSYRGGIGTDITILRPKDAKVNNSAKKSSGAVSFMPLFSNATTTLGQQGRRGALLITLDIRHPDTLDFIWSKSKPEQVFGVDDLTGKTADISGANISLKTSSEFMKAVQEDGDWTFTFPDPHHEKYDEEWDGDYEKWLEKGYPVKEYETVKAK